MAAIAPDGEADRQLRDFAANLRLACDQRGSISRICREIGINRQQFNKYLSGRHRPSPRSLRLIANHFGLSPDLLLAGQDGFRALVDGNYFDTFDRLSRQPQVMRFLDTVMSTPRAETDALLGVYDRYHYSSIYTHRILKAPLCIYRSGDLLQHAYIERFPSRDRPSRSEYIFKYHGFVLPIEDRIFTVDFENVQRNELTFGILSAVQRNATTLMFGITSGIAATMFRQPFATRLALHYRRPGLLGRDDILGATALDMDDATIPREVRDYLGDKPDMMKPA